MVALSKCFAMFMAFGAALAAPLADSDEAPTDATMNVTAVPLDARPNHNPSAAAVFRGTNDRSVVVMMAFSQVPASVARALSDGAYRALRQSIENKFLTFMDAQNPALRAYWNDLVRGNIGYVYSLAREQNGVIQYQLAIELNQANPMNVASYIIQPIVRYLHNANVYVVQHAGPLHEQELEVEARGIAPPRGRPSPGRCGKIPNVDIFPYMNNNPPAIFNGNGYLWCL